MSGIIRRGASLAALVVAIAATPALAADFKVEMLNTGPMGAMVFEPPLTKIAAGDTITFVPTDKPHNAESIRGMIPEGAEMFKGALNTEITVTFTVPGVYGIKCSPHYAMGMVALVVVDDPASNLDAAKSARNPPKAAERLTTLFTELEAGQPAQ